MIDTSMGKSMGGMAPQPMNPQIAQQRRRVTGSPMGGMQSMRSARPITPMNASAGRGFNPGNAQSFGYKGGMGNVSPQSFGYRGGLDPSPMKQRIQADPLMAADAGPVANTAPPMFMPPPPNAMGDMMGGNTGATGGSMLMDQYTGQRDPRFRY